MTRRKKKATPPPASPPRPENRTTDAQPAPPGRSTSPGFFVGVATAVMVAVLAWFARDVVDLKATTDRVRRVIPGGSEQDLSYHFVDYDHDRTVAWPAGTSMSPVLKRYLSSRTPVGGDSGFTEKEIRLLSQELTTTGATVASQTFGLFLKSQRRQPIRIINVVPIELRRGPVYDKALVIHPPQGDESSSTMVFNLDETSPRARAVKDHNINQVRGWFFPGHTFALPEDKLEPILIHLAITRGSVSFKLRIDYLIGDQPGSITISDKGHPIRLTAYNCVGANRASYQQALQAGGEYFEPVKKPRRMHVSYC